MVTPMRMSISQKCADCGQRIDVRRPGARCTACQRKPRRTDGEQAYQERMEAVRQHLRTLNAHLDAHNDRWAIDPKNYGYAGDLAHVEELVRQAAEFLADGPR